MAFDGHDFEVYADGSINFCSPTEFSYRSKLFHNSFFKMPLYDNRASINHHTFAKEVTKVTLFPVLLYYHFTIRRLNICGYKQISH